MRGPKYDGCKRIVCVSSFCIKGVFQSSGSSSTRSELTYNEEHRWPRRRVRGPMKRHGYLTYLTSVACTEIRVMSWTLRSPARTTTNAIFLVPTMEPLHRTAMFLLAFIYVFSSLPRLSNAAEPEVAVKQFHNFPAQWFFFEDQPVSRACTSVVRLPN